MIILAFMNKYLRALLFLILLTTLIASAKKIKSDINKRIKAKVLNQLSI